MSDVKYLVIDDVFKDPEAIVDMAKSYFTYYSSKELNPVNKNGDKWKGHRSEFLEVETKQPLIREIIIKVLNELRINDFVSLEGALFNINAQTQVAFHYTTKEFQYEETPEWVHTDPNFLYSGVVYLQKNPPLNSGTILFDGTNKVIVENKYNRLLLYRSDLMHSSQSGYGETIHDARFVLLFFVDKILLNLEKR